VGVVRIALRDVGNKRVSGNLESIRQIESTSGVVNVLGLSVQTKTDFELLDPGAAELIQEGSTRYLKGCFGRLFGASGPLFVCGSKCDITRLIVALRSFNRGESVGLAQAKLELILQWGCHLGATRE